jgi:hypothetical protein
VEESVTGGFSDRRFCTSDNHTADNHHLEPLWASAFASRVVASARQKRINPTTGTPKSHQKKLIKHFSACFG